MNEKKTYYVQSKNIPRNKNFIIKISNQEIPKYKHQTTSCTSSNPGNPDSDKKLN